MYIYIHIYIPGGVGFRRERCGKQGESTLPYAHLACLCQNNAGAVLRPPRRSFPIWSKTLF